MGSIGLAWSGTAFSLVGLAYLVSAPRLLGKRPDGSIGAIFLVVLLPYFLAVWGLWMARRLSRENAWDEVVPGLFLGGWPVNGKVPTGVEVVVDMTAEFPARLSLVRVRDYVCLPTLDLAVPPMESFVGIADRVAAKRSPVYLHCGVGHGRAALMAAAILMCRGAARTSLESIEILKTARPRVRLGAGQLAFLRAFEAHLRAVKEA